MRAALAGAGAGLLMGYALQRSQLCFHATFAGVYERRVGLLRAWALACAVGVLGLTVLYAGGWWSLNEGLPLLPVRNVVGGLLIGVGMHVAMSCASGLFFKLGAGMLGTLVGLGGWAAGELAVRDLRLPGERWGVRAGGDSATLPGFLDLPRAAVAIPVASAVVVGLVVWSRRRPEDPTRAWQWSWVPAGLAVGGAAVASFALAGVAGRRFGASTVGAVSSLATGPVDWWLVAFLGAIVMGAHVAARHAGGLWVRGETPIRYAQLTAGGFLLGAGGRIGGGCNLGHGLSGVAELNVSSLLVVVAIVGGIGLARAARRAVRVPVPVPVELT